MPRTSQAQKVMASIDDQLIEQGRQDALSILKRELENGGAHVRWLVEYDFPRSNDGRRQAFHWMLKKYEQHGLGYIRSTKSVAIFFTRPEAEIFRGLVHKYGGKAKLWLSIQIDRDLDTHRGLRSAEEP